VSLAEANAGQDQAEPDPLLLARGIITGSGMREPGVLSHLEPLYAATIDETTLERIVGE
jgi:hypothetical protein